MKGNYSSLMGRIGGYAMQGISQTARMLTSKTMLTLEGLGLLATINTGCANLAKFDYNPHIKGGIEHVLNTMQAYNGEIFPVQAIPEGKQVKTMVYLPQDGPDLDPVLTDESIAVIPKYDGNGGNVSKGTLNVVYQDGSSEALPVNVTTVVETEGDMSLRKYVEDSEARSNLVHGIYALRNGKRLVPESGNVYVRKEDFVRLSEDMVDKLGLRKEAGMDVQANLGNFLEALTGKATYCYRDNLGRIHATNLTGILESVDYMAKQLLAAGTNGTEYVTQHLAINDDTATGIAKAGGTLDGIVEFLEDNSPIGSGTRRTVNRTMHLLLGDGFKLNEDAIAVGKTPQGYDFAVRETPFRATAETIGTVTVNGVLFYVSWAAATEGGSSGGGGLGGPVIGPKPPPPPFP